MSNFGGGLGRTRVFAKVHNKYVVGEKPAENTAQRKKGPI